jgi:hypothetical protein
MDLQVFQAALQPRQPDSCPVITADPSSPLQLSIGGLVS